MTSKFLRLGLAALFILAVLALCGYLHWIFIPAKLFAAVRCIAILFFACYATERRSLAAWIFVGMAAGVEFGHDWPTVAVQLQVLGSVFLRLIKVIVAPLLFGTLVVGIAGHADIKKVGRIGLKALIYFEIVSTLGLILGFVAINISHAGVGVHLENTAKTETIAASSHTVSDFILNVFPENIAKAVADNQILQIVVFSIIFGIALAMVPEIKRRPMLDFASSLCETMFKFTNIVMLAAPIGVFGAIAYTVGHVGIEVLIPLFRLLTTMYVSLVVFVLVVLLPILWMFRIPLKPFLAAVGEPVTIAFATSSSEASLPIAMEKLEAVGVSQETVALVLPTGYSFNLAGSGIYQSLALVFVAETAGIHLTFGQQFIMLLTLLVSSKGIAGVARASLVVVLAVAASSHLPLEPVFLLLGIDQLMDMGRTGVNVLGNCLATVVVAIWEGEKGLFQKSPVSPEAQGLAQ